VGEGGEDKRPTLRLCPLASLSRVSSGSGCCHGLNACPAQSAAATELRPPYSYADLAGANSNREASRLLRSAPRTGQKVC